MPGLNLAIIGLFERLLWGITLLRRKHVSAEAMTAMAADTEACCASIRQRNPVWMTSALQGKNALIARLVSTVLCTAFDRGIRLSRWP